MISSEQISQAKAVSIAAYLESQGYFPERQTHHELLYRSPLRNESTPSFHVHIEKNVFKDFGCDEYRGDVVRLCQLLEKLSFQEAIGRLLPLQAIAFSFSGYTPSVQRKQSSQLELIDIKPLTNPLLLEYAAHRRIPKAIAISYLQEIHYQRLGKRYFAAGFVNDLGGYALRNGAGFKGQTQPAGISSFPVAGSRCVCVFEGFFDFLSALVYYGLSQPRYHTIVLNSTAHLSKAISALESFDKVNCFFDQDTAGKKAIAFLHDKSLPIQDCSNLYEGFNDFNEFLIHTTL